MNKDTGILNTKNRTWKIKRPTSSKISLDAWETITVDGVAAAVETITVTTGTTFDNGVFDASSYIEEFLGDMAKSAEQKMEDEIIELEIG